MNGWIGGGDGKRAQKAAERPEEQDRKKTETEKKTERERNGEERRERKKGKLKTTEAMLV